MQPSLTPPTLARDTTSIQTCELTHLAVFSAQGLDAVSFLHGQLTQDVSGLQADAGARLAGYCTAKGRLLASLVVWHEPTDPPGVLGFVDAGVVAPFLKRLSMFVLRAKVKLAPAPLRVTGVWLADAAAEAARASLEAAAGGPLPALPWQRAELPSGTWIAAPGTVANAPATRWWWVTGDAQHEAHDGALAAVSAPGSLDAWRAADIHAGLPWIEAGLQDTVIPQTVNFDLIGGVNFRKGCYPGQEIVARSHYLGKVKRRAVVGHSTGDVPAAGTDVYLAGDPQPNGRVINAAAIPGGVALLFETTLASTDTPLHVGSADGPPIALQPLPYPLDTHGD